MGKVGAKRNEVPPPFDQRSNGEVSFNYDSHDGRFLIGRDKWEFETKWSAHGHDSLFIYNDPPSIRGVAIAESIVAIEMVTEEIVFGSDFTKRTREPSVGQVVIVENQNGYFAALQLLEVSKSEVPSGNRARFRFAIKTDAAKDFSSFVDSFDAERNHFEALLQAATEAKESLLRVRGGETPDANLAGMGHNQPPAEFAISEVDRLDTIKAIDGMINELKVSSPALGKLAPHLKVVAAAVKAIGGWCTRKVDLAAEEYVKTIGKAAAIVTVGSAAMWLVAHAKLANLAILLAAFAG